MTPQPFHERLAELWIINKQRPLTPEEMTEIQHCLAANVKYCWEHAYLANLSLIASMTEDWAWQHEICAEIDRLDAGKPKRPRSKKTSKSDS